MFRIFLILCFCATTAHSSSLFSWVQAVSKNNLSIRSIVNENDNCPIAVIDGKDVEMTIRVSPDPKHGFYEKVCEVITLRSAKSIVVDDRPMPVLNEKISKIAIVGDTGCRVSSLEQQNCKSSSDWPFSVISRAIASHNPDLAIHVGDYLYREKKCRNDEKCGKVYGDRFWTWKADWFIPAREMLSKSVLLFVRGNHESCQRSYRGWFRYLDEDSDPMKLLENCNEFVSSWSFDLEKLRLQVFDSSSFDDFDLSSYRNYDIRSSFLASLQDGKETWLLTHKPVWGYVNRGKSWRFYEGNVIQQQSFGDLLVSSGVSNIFSGHSHIAQVLTTDGLVNQFIVGNGGAFLYGQEDPEDSSDIKIGGVNVKSVKSIKGFGFAIVDIDDNKVTFYDSANNKMYEHSLVK